MNMKIRWCLMRFNNGARDYELTLFSTLRG